MMTPSHGVGDTHIEIVTLLLVGRSGPPWRSAAPIDAQDSRRMRDIIVAHGGAAFDSDDGTLGGAFESAAAALDAALSIRQGGATLVERRPEAVRMPLHSGGIHGDNGRYMGMPLDRAAHILAARLQGDLERAHASYAEALELARELGDQLSIAEGLERLAAAAGAAGHAERAALLGGAAEAVRQALDAPIPEADRAEHHQLVAAWRTELGEAAFPAEWAAGRALTLEQLQALPQLEPRDAATPAAYPAELTQREVEVLRLIAHGLTDAQIAEQLVISPRTVNSHLRTIYSKVEVTTRTAAARFAHEHGLV